MKLTFLFISFFNFMSLNYLLPFFSPSLLLSQISLKKRRKNKIPFASLLWNDHYLLKGFFPSLLYITHLGFSFSLSLSHTCKHYLGISHKIKFVPFSSLSLPLSFPMASTSFCLRFSYKRCWNNSLQKGEKGGKNYW